MSRTITVRGTGKVTAVADEVILFLVLTARDKDYASAAQKADEQTEALQNAVQRAGFAPSELKTVDFNVRVEYENVRDETGVYRNVRKGFACERRLKLEFGAEPARLKETLQSLAACEAQPELSLSFSVRDRNGLQERALRAAAENAGARARVLCDAAGVKLGALLEIRHEEDQNIPLSPSRIAAADVRTLAATPFAADINPDDVVVESSAVFTWEIE